MFNWLTRVIKAKAYKRRRSFLEAEYHKNTPNRLERVLNGLELLSAPLEYKGESYLPLPLVGTLALRAQTMDILVARLEFMYMEYNRVLASTGNYPDWSELPKSLSKKLDSDEEKWLDEYFATSHETVVRDKLIKAWAVLSSFKENETKSPEREVFLNQISHILRELETVVEHYL